MSIGKFEWGVWQRALVKALKARAKRNQKPVEWGGAL
jgi:hypothetical protein